MSEMYGFWFDAAGKRLERMKPFELKEAKRLFAKHADIRTGSFKPKDADLRLVSKTMRE
jgi:hypothetical protein